LNYVQNTVDGFLAAATATEALGKTFNLGTGKEISIGDLVQFIAKLIGTEIDVETESCRVRPLLSEVDRLMADRSLAESILRWSPRVDLENGLKETIDWIKDHPEYFRSSDYAV
jgi:nucleoside-diphosphate-sugar epimerase